MEIKYLHMLSPSANSFLSGLLGKKYNIERVYFINKVRKCSDQQLGYSSEKKSKLEEKNIFNSFLLFQKNVIKTIFTSHNVLDVCFFDPFII